MKVIVFFAIVLIGFGISARSQTETTELSESNYALKARQETKAMIVKLALSKVQTDSVGKINRNFYFNMAQLKKFTLSTAERYGKLKAFEDEWRTGLQGNLTTEQFNQYFQEKSRAKERMRQRMDSIKLTRLNQNN